MFLKSFSALLALGLTALAAAPHPAQAQTAQATQKPVLTTLHRFNGVQGDNAQSSGALTLGKDGSFYGVTFASINSGGIIYKIDLLHKYQL